MHIGDGEVHGRLTSMVPLAQGEGGIIAPRMLPVAFIDQVMHLSRDAAIAIQMAGVRKPRSCKAS